MGAELDPRKKVVRWKRRLKAARRAFDADYFKPSRKIVDRYRDDRRDTGGRITRRYNILFSNVSTLQPAVYAKMPSVVVSRRFQDRDPIARVACQVLERATTYELEPEQGDFHSRMKQARDDYLLTARGVLWVRYEATFNEVPPAEPEEEPTDGAPASDTDPPELAADAVGMPSVERIAPVAMNAEGASEDDQSITDTVDEEVESEHAPVDYVFWKDFLHDPAPVWQEVGWGSRDVLMSKEKSTKRFGEELAARLKYTHRRMEDDDKKAGSGGQKNDDVDLAMIHEIWDKETKTAIWISPDVDDRPLDERPDPLRLTGFFPFPPPLYATLTTDTLVPRADYKFYEDQANEIDELTNRIRLLTKALAVRGVYDGSSAKLADLLNERPENYLVAVSGWAAFAEKGKLKGAIDFLPIDVIAAVLTSLIEKRALLIQDIYQLTGISDIVRGQSDPNETLGAQEIKGSFATLRLDERKRAVGAFARNTIGMVAEIIAEHFHPDTIRKMSGFDEMTEVAELNQQQPGAADMLWEQVIGLIKNDKLRGFKLDIETDSTVVMNKIEEQTRRTEFLSATGAFLKQAMDAMQVKPELGPLLGQMLLFGVRGFNVGRELEGAFEEAIQKLQAQAQQPQMGNPAEAAKAQATTAVAQSKIQSQQQHDAMRAQEMEQTAQLEQGRQQLDAQKQAHEQASDAAQQAHEQRISASEHAHSVHRERQAAGAKAKLSLLDVVMKHSVAARKQKEAVH